MTNPEQRHIPETAQWQKELRLWWATAYWWLLSREKETEPSFTMSEETVSNLAAADQLISKGHPVVLYLNHQSFKDVSIGVQALFRHLPHMDTILCPTSMRHYDFRRNFGTALGLSATKIMGMFPVRIVQEKDKARYGAEKVNALSRELRAITAEFINTDRGVVYSIFPEGTRSRNGQLMQFLPGLASLAQKESANPVTFLPMGLMYPKTTGKAEIVVGRPTQIPEGVIDTSASKADQRTQITDFLAVELAKLLPESMHGVYAELVQELEQGE